MAGLYPNGLVVVGYCDVNSGPAHVLGAVRVTAGSVLVAAFGNAGSALSVIGDVRVKQGATFVMGCNTTSFPCLDDANPASPNLISTGTVTGDIRAYKPLAVIVHSTRVDGSVDEVGGGGGISCATPSNGPFAAFHSPVYSDFEDNIVTGHLYVARVNSCWLGVARDDVGGSLKLIGNVMGDPDAIEVLSNVVHGDLVCLSNRPILWDSTEASPSSLFPRALERNDVAGMRMGQCQTAGPVIQGAPALGGPF